MQFPIIEISGRTHLFTGATAETCVGDVKQFMAPLLGADAADRVILLFRREQLNENSTTLASLGLTFENVPPFLPTSGTFVPFKMHALLKFRAPAKLLDGNVYPFVLNGVKIGGDLLQRRDENDEEMLEEDSFERFVALLRSLASGRKRRGGGGCNAAGNDGQTSDPSDVCGVAEDVAVLDQLAALEEYCKNHGKSLSGDEFYPTTIPTCLKKLVSDSILREACFSNLNFNPIVVDNFADFTSESKYNTPLFVQFDALDSAGMRKRKAGLMFLFDHQGCCYWYAVWDVADAHTPSSPESVDLAKAVPSSENASVYVLFGGQSFDINASAYLTSTSFWRFLCDFARVSLPTTQEGNVLDD